MSLIEVDKFLAAVREIMEEKPQYRKGGSGDDRTCDCIGLIIGAIRRCGGIWKGTHGSNYAARFEVENLRKIGSVNDLKVGDWVFKAWEPTDDGWSLPEAYEYHPDQRDYYHVGVVASVAPLQIIHCTTPTVKMDTKLGKWKYAAEGKKIDMSKGGAPMETKKAIVDRPAGVEGETVNLREGPGTKYGRIEKIAFGTEIEVMKDLGEWCYVRAGEHSGYMMSNFILYEGDPDVGDVDAETGIPEEVREALREIVTMADVLKEKLEEIGDMIASVVGRG